MLNDKTEYGCFDKIEDERKKLLQNGKFIDVEDFGAGSALIKANKRAINKIAATSLKHLKYSRLLYRIVKHYQPYSIVELGTSFGITTAYMALANPAGKVFTLEGAPAIAEIAQQQFDALGLQQVHLIQGKFDDSLSKLLASVKKADLVFIDGDHRKEATLRYFEQLLSICTNSSMIILDDIHWSEGMEEAWEIVKLHPRVTLTIDLFFIGIVCLNDDIKVKQHFCIRF